MRTAEEQHAWETHAESLAPRLLGIMEKHTGAPGLAYDAPPTPLSGGHWAGLYHFRLLGRPQPLVLRIMPTSDEQCAREAAVQGCVAAAGFPAPRVIFSAGRNDGLRFPFIVMERLPGRTLAAGPGAAWRMPRLLAETLARLHALDPAPLAGTLGDLDGVLADIAERSAPLGEGGFASGRAWLTRHRPPEKRRAICHGDFHALNLLLDGGRVSGVLDWTQALVAEPEYDVAYASLMLALWPLASRRLPRRWAKRLLGAPAARHFVGAYRRRARLDEGRLAWYEALHAYRMLLRVARARAGITLPPLGENHPWELVAGDARLAFARRSGVTIDLPARCATPPAS